MDSINLWNRDRAVLEMEIKRCLYPPSFVLKVIKNHSIAVKSTFCKLHLRSLTTDGLEKDNFHVPLLLDCKQSNIKVKLQ